MSTADTQDRSLDPENYTIHRATVRDDVDIAYVREGVGGVPLMLLHGWPETMRIWWHNIGPLADAGFEVIVPDLRGFGESSIPSDGRYDIAAHSHDMKALLDLLGHEAAVFAGGDYGGCIIQDFAHRYPDQLIRQVLFNVLTPILPELYEAHGVGGNTFEEVNQVSDHILRQANEADELAAELPSAKLRRSYIAGFYTYRHWAALGSFDQTAVDFMTEPYGDADKFRSSMALYEAFIDPSKVPEPPLLTSPHTKRTLILYGNDDRVVEPTKFTRRMPLACADAAGPFVIERAGHFLQFEQPDIFNEAVRIFCLDLLKT